MADNIISAVVAPLTLDEVLSKLDEISALLPFLISLTPGQRKSLHKMGNQTVAYVQSAYSHAVQHPALVPTYINMAEFKKDVDLVVAVSSILSKAYDLINGLEDTGMLAGSEAINYAGAFYDAVKIAAKKNVAGAKAIAADLKTNFVRSTPVVVPPIV
jgi:hypothetical protein